MTANDLPTGDPLSGAGINFTSLTQSIFDDYNNINSAYIRLADSTTDPGYTPARGVERTIEICFGGVGVGRAGEARRNTKDGRVTGCTINLTSGEKDSAKSLVATLTHEIGHCLGLDHAQDSVNSIMSYFAKPDTLRLQIDDKMGIINLFPTNPSQSKEKPNLGFSCAPS